jgi:hypothetical protein
VITIGHKNKAAKYADFIDQGVNGTQTNYGAPYSYKSKMPSRAMVDNIKKWLKGNKRSGRNEDQKKGTNNVQKKREGLQDTQDNAAFGIAISVLRKGHKPTHFLSDAVKKNFGKKFIKDYAKEFGKIIKANITNDYNK